MPAVYAIHSSRGHPHHLANPADILASPHGAAAPSSGLASQKWVDQLQYVLDGVRLLLTIRSQVLRGRRADGPSGLIHAGNLSP